VAFQRRKTEAIGVKAPLPGFIEPALASSIEKVPSGGRWIHEIKFDGYRVQLHLANEAVRIFTRRGNDWTKRFKKVAHDAWRIKAASAGPLPQGRWVCENNPDLPWLGDHARCGAGAPAVTSRMADIT
jgi:hypothetical protein